MKSSDIMTRPQDLKKSPKSFLNITNQMSQQSGRFFFKFFGPSQNTYMNFKIQFQRQSVSLKVEFPIFIQFSLSIGLKTAPPNSY